jgi:hypothetical protein
MKKSIFLIFVLLFFLTFPAAAENITVGPAEFVDSDGDANTFTLENRGEYLYKTKNTEYLYAGVHLPDEVIIKSVTLNCFDYDGFYNIVCRLVRVNKYTKDYDVLFTCSSSGSSVNIQKIIDSSCSPTASYRKVNNGVCNYFLELKFETIGGSLQFYGIAVTYMK